MSGCALKTICLMYYVCELRFSVEEVLEIMGERAARQALKELMALKLLRKRGKRFKLAVDICAVYRDYLECIRRARKRIGGSTGEEMSAIFACLREAVEKHTSTQR